MIAFLLLIPCSVEIQASARYDSPYTIEAIAFQEAAGIWGSIRDSDETSRIKDAVQRLDLTRQRITELLRAVRASATTLDVRHPASGAFGYSYSFHYRGLKVVRALEWSPGHLGTSVEISGPIHSESQRVGPAVGTGTLRYVQLEVEAVEDGDGRTKVRVAAEAVLSVHVQPISRCLCIRRIVETRGPRIAAREVRRIAQERINRIPGKIIQRGRSIAAAGRTTQIWKRIADRGLDLR